MQNDTVNSSFIRIFLHNPCLNYTNPSPSLLSFPPFLFEINK